MTSGRRSERTCGDGSRGRGLRAACRFERPFAPASDLRVQGHLIPVFGTVPSDLVLTVVLVDSGGAGELGEVDQVYVLVPGADVLELYPRRSVELHGVGDVLAPPPTSSTHRPVSSKTSRTAASSGSSPSSI